MVVRDHFLHTHLLLEVARRHKLVIWAPGANEQPVPVFQCYFSGRGLEDVDIALVGVGLYTPPRSAKIENACHQDCGDGHNNPSPAYSQWRGCFVTLQITLPYRRP